MKLVIGIAFVAILAVLGSALVFLMRDRGSGKRTARALALRVTLSALLLAFIWFSYWMGWIEPRRY
jgi:hypothetical protein